MEKDKYGVYDSAQEEDALGTCKLELTAQNRHLCHYQMLL